MKPSQVRMARAALKISVQELADAAGIHRNTVWAFENGKYAGEPETLAAIRKALEDAGVVLIEENGGGAGVRLKKPDGS